MSDKVRLLVVDDDLKFLQSLAQRLQLRGFEVTTAANGQEALDKARAQTFDLALLDLKMPSIDGCQVLEVLKKEHQWLEVIILTGHGSIDSAIECTKLGAFDYLSKPYELDNLLQALNRAYQARLAKKFESDESRLEKISELALGSSPLNVLRELRKLDNEEK